MNKASWVFQLKADPRGIPRVLDSFNPPRKEHKKTGSGFGAPRVQG